MKRHWDVPKVKEAVNSLSDCSQARIRNVNGDYLANYCISNCGKCRNLNKEWVSSFTQKYLKENKEDIIDNLDLCEVRGMYQDDTCTVGCEKCKEESLHWLLAPVLVWEENKEEQDDVL